MTVPASSGVHLREIAEDDLPGVADLLSRGFWLRSKDYWLRGLRRQASRQLPAGSPKYGYVLVDGGQPVGAVLVFSSTMQGGEGPVLRSNLSSWYVEPKYRSFGSLLITSALKRNKDATYFNVSPACHTWETVEAQGFSPYCRGDMACIPALSRRAESVTIEVITEDSTARGDPEIAVLAEHARFGCLSMMVHHDRGDFPFVFQKQWLKRILPYFRLMYCRDIAHFAQFAGNLGRFLLRHGPPVVVVDANVRVPGLIGIYSEARGRKYFRGPNTPRLGDLAFSESVFFG